MASGPEHYAVAEKCLGRLAALDYGSDEAREQLLEAQVHATLAHAAATAMSEGGMMPGREFDAWAAACASQPVPAVGSVQVYWLDSGGESPEPDLYATHGAAYAAGVTAFRAANPQQFLPSELVWSEVDGPDALELVAAGSRTGIFVRPIRPKDGA